MISERDIKKDIRRLRKLKRETRKYTNERREINKRIRELKASLKDAINKDASPEKERLIKEIENIDKQKGTIRLINLRVYSIEQLRVHLERIRPDK